MAPHPLHNLTQVIHVDQTKLLFTSTIDEHWRIHLFAADESSTKSWNASVPLDEVCAGLPAISSDPDFL